MQAETTRALVCHRIQNALVVRRAPGDQAIVGVIFWLLGLLISGATVVTVAPMMDHTGCQAPVQSQLTSPDR